MTADPFLYAYRDRGNSLNSGAEILKGFEQRGVADAKLANDLTSHQATIAKMAGAEQPKGEQSAAELAAEREREEAPKLMAPPSIKKNSYMKECTADLLGLGLW